MAASKQLLNECKQQQDEQAQQVDDLKHHAAARVKAMEENSKALEAHLQQLQDADTRAQSSRWQGSELAVLWLKHAKEAEETAKQKV